MPIENFIRDWTIVFECQNRSSQAADYVKVMIPNGIGVDAGKEAADYTQLSAGLA